MAISWPRILRVCDLNSKKLKQCMVKLSNRHLWTVYNILRSYLGNAQYAKNHLTLCTSCFDFGEQQQDYAMIAMMMRRS